MSKYIGIFLLFSVLNFGFAKEITSSIHLIDLGRPSEKALVFINADGRVLTLNKDNKILINELNALIESNLEVILQVEGEEVIDFTFLPFYLGKSVSSPKSIAAYEPTNFSSEADAVQLFDQMNPRTRRRSECFNRAHIWTYDWNTKLGTKSLKVFLFFTAQYIRNYNYNWWFHVSPYVLVNSTDTVMDKEFAEGPMAMKDWTDMFIQSKATCPHVNKYSEYRNNQFRQDCYLMKASMYYWEPNDLAANERDGTNKTEWISWEINSARNQAFY